MGTLPRKTPPWCTFREPLVRRKEVVILGIPTVIGSPTRPAQSEDVLSE